VFYYNVVGNPWHRATREACAPTPTRELPEFSFSARQPRVPMPMRLLSQTHPAPRALTLTPFMIDIPVETMPVDITGTTKRRAHHGKADPIWDTRFTTKFSRKPAADKPAITPKGALNVIERFIDKAAELDYLINTQHLELATTRAELSANGIGCISLSQSVVDEDGEPISISADDVVKSESIGVEPEDIAWLKREHGVTDAQIERLMVINDPVYAANVARRIDWERYIYASGPIHTARFEATAEGTLGVDYIGAKKHATPEVCLATRKALKNAWLDRVGPLPTVAEIKDKRSFCAFYNNKPVLAHMSEAERNADTDSRRFGAEDPDPERIAFHAENPRTAKWTECFDDEGNFDGMITDDLPGGIVDVGYAGPQGFLGLDDANDDEDDFEYSAD
jgi:hypothetical protein